MLALHAKLHGAGSIGFSTACLGFGIPYTQWHPDRRNAESEFTLNPVEGTIVMVYENATKAHPICLRASLKKSCRNIGSAS